MYHSGSKNTLTKIHPNDLVRFKFNCSDGSLELFVNDISQGNMFNDVPPGVSPCAAFYGSELKTVKINYVRRTDYVPPPTIEEEPKVETDSVSVVLRSGILEYASSENKKVRCHP